MTGSPGQYPLEVIFHSPCPPPAPPRPPTPCTPQKNKKKTSAYNLTAQPEMSEIILKGCKTKLQELLIITEKCVYTHSQSN